MLALSRRHHRRHGRPGHGRDVADELGGVDILVNGAARRPGHPSPRELADLVDDAILAAFDTKLLGYLRCARAAAPYMPPQGWGRIINISGLAARGVGTAPVRSAMSPSPP